jgi:hypothetical protein
MTGGFGGCGTLVRHVREGLAGLGLQGVDVLVAPQAAEAAVRGEAPLLWGRSN